MPMGEGNPKGKAASGSCPSVAYAIELHVENLTYGNNPIWARPQIFRKLLSLKDLQQNKVENKYISFLKIKSAD